MGVIALMCSVVDSPVADIPITEAPAITDGIETTVNSVGDHPPTLNTTQ